MINFDEDDAGNTSLEELKRQFFSFSTVKENEIAEASEAWRYYHGAQWTKKQRDELAKRGQPCITFDRISGKINGLVGTIIRLRSDPKAFPVTNVHDDGADVATAVLRYILDSSKWSRIETRAVLAGAVHGIGVIEIGLESNGNELDIMLNYVHPQQWFRDPRSIEPDFSDAKFMGVSKIVDKDEIEMLFPGSSANLSDSGNGFQFTQFDSEIENIYFQSRNKYRLVEHWYKKGGMWRFCFYVGDTKLASGESPFVDSKGKSIPRYIAFAANIDHDGDIYGFVRRFKGPQDARNQHRSKALAIMNMRQLVARRGTFKDFDVARREIMKPNGALEYDGERENFEIIQPAQEFLQQTEYFNQATQEIDSFGPNPALLGTPGAQGSGRALSIIQQAGMAELIFYISSYRAWKEEVYRDVWATARKFMTNQKVIRITDNEGLAQFMNINYIGVDQNGVPNIINSLGSIDVDIILDEGPDTTSIIGDIFDTLSALAQNNVPIPPQIFVELSGLPKGQKDKILQMLQPAPPDVGVVQAEMNKNEADLSKTLAEARDKNASAMQKEATVAQSIVDVPQQIGENYVY